MNIFFVIKSLVLSLMVFILIYAISLISTQKNVIVNNNYTIKDSIKESINIAKYRVNGEITFDQEQLIKSTILNYIDNNNINLDNVTFEIYLDEQNDIVTVSIYSEKDVFDKISKADYTFAYQVIEK